LQLGGAGKANPIFGMGALGNENTGRMYYTGSNKKENVMLVQQMPESLGFDWGITYSGPDGIFGNNTAKAVKEFQSGYRDRRGEKLNVDGLVGPEIADALNRTSVGDTDDGYDRHQTEKELTKNFALLTVSLKALKQPVTFDVSDTEKGRVVINEIVPQKDKSR